MSRPSLLIIFLPTSKTLCDAWLLWLLRLLLLLLMLQQQPY
jgi:hypothetical protein